MNKAIREDVRGYFTRSAVSAEFFDLIVGDHLASGAFREVFHYAPDDRYVVKVELTQCLFYNIMEWRIWNFFQKKPLGKWLVPCHRISMGGTFLIQHKATDVFGPDLPEEVPELFCDLKQRNWGRYKGRVVCLDYANLRFMELADTEKKRRADWKWQTTRVKE